MDLDSFQEEIGGISKYQIFVVIVAPLVVFGSAFHSQSAIFLSAVPNHRCAVPPIDDPKFYNLTENEIRNYTIPYNALDKEYDSCNRYAYNLSECTGGDDFSCITPKDQVGIIPCDKGYWYDRSVYEETTISQWDLVCDRQYLDTIANTLYFLGFFIGSMFVGPLSDWFGRKVAMIVITLGLASTGVGCSFAPTFEIYVFVRVLVACFSITSFIAVYTYASEISSKKWRTEVGAYVCVMSAIAHAVYPGLAYAIRDWHYLQLTISLIPAALFLIFFFIPESPRWLLVQGRLEEAKSIFSRYAKSAGKELTEEMWKLIVKSEEDKKENAIRIKEKSKKVKVWDLFRRPIMRLLSINVMLCWFTVSMVFYGLALNGESLAGDPYLNTALNGAVEIVAAICVYFAYPLGRRPVLSASFLMAGIACLVSMLSDLFSGENTNLLTASTAFAIIGKFFATVAFDVVYAVTAEIYPTDARSTGVSMGSMAARVGGMLSPLILQLQTSIPWFTQTVFGSLSIVAGIASLFYPETATTEYFTTMDEAKDFYWDNIAILKRFKRKRKYPKTTEKGRENNAYVLDDNGATKL